ncbi:hypothetical protein MKW98_011431 [Papaver atlanticum]|uniref:Uncharacterized protein n=1 Tax=Papaver atlanticum TaxID=357466 RepID=A0AAD4XF63_9MAGN|nr:hypothetical protein MKW98_011431 [Papaver atlanticum]
MSQYENVSFIAEQMKETQEEIFSKEEVCQVKMMNSESSCSRIEDKQDELRETTSIQGFPIELPNTDWRDMTYLLANKSTTEDSFQLLRVNMISGFALK